ncbi:MAG TPA: peptidase [Candidatus Micrarchaeia archaeon]|nr:peptidase [Candidatus Micrarchaeia archaeon]
MNRIFLSLSILCLSLSFLLPSAAEARKEKFHFGKVGVMHRQFVPPEPYDWRGVKTHALVTDIWYPADPTAVEKEQWVGSPSAPFALAGKAAPDVPMIAAPQKLPLILLSHGTGGSSPMMAWLGIALARHGYITAAVNHPGNNALEPYTIQGFSIWWERARDLTSVLNAMLADSTFGPRIDPTRIGAAGFSLGGFTMIEIAGGIGELSRFQEFCKSPRADAICGDPPEFPGLTAKALALAKTDAAMQAALREGDESHRDPRIRAVFAIAPALGQAFIPDSLARIAIPVKIVLGSADDIAPPDTNGKFLAAHIPRAQLTVFQDVGHYTFLATCLELGDQTQPKLCLDRAGVLRDDIHAQTANLAYQFFNANLR